MLAQAVSCIGSELVTTVMGALAWWSIESRLMMMCIIPVIGYLLMGWLLLARTGAILRWCGITAPADNAGLRNWSVAAVRVMAVLYILSPLYGIIPQLITQSDGDQQAYAWLFWANDAVPIAVGVLLLVCSRHLGDGIIRGMRPDHTSSDPRASRLAVAAGMAGLTLILFSLLNLTITVTSALMFVQQETDTGMIAFPPAEEREQMQRAVWDSLQGNALTEILAICCGLLLITRSQWFDRLAAAGSSVTDVCSDGRRIIGLMFAAYMLTGALRVVLLPPLCAPGAHGDAAGAGNWQAILGLAVGICLLMWRRQNFTTDAAEGAAPAAAIASAGRRHRHGH
ncbi:MAG TPA: hypothetical protein PKM88_11820 [bacterium]|nr:hypothetical protein [bacterium]